jgi:hypothetical protein
MEDLTGGGEGAFGKRFTWQHARLEAVKGINLFGTVSVLEPENRRNPHGPPRLGQANFW